MHTNIYTRCLLYRSLKNALSRSHGSTDPLNRELPHLALDITRAKASTTLTEMAGPHRRPGCHERPHWMALRRDTKAIVNDRTACSLMERSKVRPQVQRHTVLQDRFTLRTSGDAPSQSC
jgi:hypothetical protein